LVNKIFLKSLPKEAFNNFPKPEIEDYIKFYEPSLLDDIKGVLSFDF